VRLPVGFRLAREPGDFAAAVLAAVATVPEGRVATYGGIAALAGRPGAARAVGSVLAVHGEDVPAHRVVTASGRLVPGWEAEQAARLRAEGVRIASGRVAEPAPWWDGPAEP
jgi:methylated-DNA-protein-cysteine methyltransferase related protein